MNCSPVRIVEQPALARQCGGLPAFLQTQPARPWRFDLHHIIIIGKSGRKFISA